MKQKWIEAIKTHDKGDYNGHGLICNLHFAQNAILKSTKNNRIRLKSDVIATIFLDTQQNETLENTENVSHIHHSSNVVPDNGELNTENFPEDVLSLKTRLDYETNITKLKIQLDSYKEKSKEELDVWKTKFAMAEKTIQQLRNENECIKKHLYAKASMPVPNV